MGGGSWWRRSERRPEADEPAPASASPADLTPALVETVARHFDGARVQGPDVALGEFDLTVTCEVESLRAVGSVQAANIHLRIAGADLPHGPLWTSIMGYQPSAGAAVVEAGCLWACSLRDVLRAGLRNEAVDGVGVRDVVVDGTRYRAAMTMLDRTIGFDATPLEPWIDVRARLGASPWFTPLVLDAGAMRSAPAGNHLLEVFIGEFDGGRSIEVTLDGADQPDAHAAFAGVAAAPPTLAMVALREYVLLRPL